jgi:plastocyanin
MKNFAFEPSEVTVPVGAIIDWIDMEGKHGVVFDGSGVADDPKDVFEVGGSLSRTFSMPGRYLYHCPAHGGAGGRGMYGVVIVSGGG